MRVAITGSTELIGSALTRSLLADGHQVVRWSATGPPAAPADGSECAHWDPVAGRVEPGARRSASSPGASHAAHASYRPPCTRRVSPSLIRRSTRRSTRYCDRPLEESVGGTKELSAGPDSSVARVRERTARGSMVVRGTGRRGSVEDG